MPQTFHCFAKSLPASLLYTAKHQYSCNVMGIQKEAMHNWTTNQRHMLLELILS